MILCNGGHEHRKRLVYHVKSTRYWARVSYIVGSPSNVADLRKAAVSQADACFLFTSARFLDEEQELAADEETLLRAISIKHHCPYVPLIMHLLSPRNRGHVLWYQLNKFSPHHTSQRTLSTHHTSHSTARYVPLTTSPLPRSLCITKASIQVVCLNEMKMKLFATSCMCPGMLGLITNLLSSYDGKLSLSSIFSSTAAALESGQSTFVSTSTQTFASTYLTQNAMTLSAWPLSSAKSPDYPSPPIPPPVPDGSSSLYYSAATRRWEEEYLFGFGQEVYTAEFPDCVDGLTFSEVAAVVYERLSLVLIGLVHTDPSTGKPKVVLNPGYACKVSVAGGDLACVIAQNAEHARVMKSVRYAHQEGGVGGEEEQGIRARWRRERAKDQQRAAEAKRASAERRRAREQRRRERKAAARRSHTINIDSSEGGGEGGGGGVVSNGPHSPDEGGGVSSTPFSPMSEEERVGEEEDVGWDVVDALSSFRCNGQSLVPSIPLSSHIAQTNCNRHHHPLLPSLPHRPPLPHPHSLPLAHPHPHSHLLPLPAPPFPPRPLRPCALRKGGRARGVKGRSGLGHPHGPGPGREPGQRAGHRPCERGLGGPRAGDGGAGG